MIKFIKTEGKTAQEVQDYFDQCIREGAQPYDFIASAVSDFSAVERYAHFNFKYAGVSNEGETLLTSELSDLIDFDLETLIAVKEIADKLINDDVFLKPDVWVLVEELKSVIKCTN